MKRLLLAVTVACIGADGCRADTVTVVPTCAEVVTSDGTTWTVSSNASSMNLLRSVVSPTEYRGVMEWGFRGVHPQSTILSARVELVPSVVSFPQVPQAELYGYAGDGSPGAADANMIVTLIGATGPVAPFDPFAVTLSAAEVESVLRQGGHMGAVLWLSTPAAQFGVFASGASVVENQPRVVLAWQPPSCIADWDGLGGVAIADVFGMINAFFASDPRADIDQDGGVSVQDIFEFLNAWFAGCP